MNLARDEIRTTHDLIVHWSQFIARAGATIMEIGMDPAHPTRQCKHVLKNRGGRSRVGFGLPGIGELPGAGVVYVEVQLKYPDHPVWDPCTVDGEHVGNRCGAAARLAEIMGDRLHALLEHRAALATETPAEESTDSDAAA